MAPTSNLNKLLVKLGKPAKKVAYRRVKAPWRRKPRAPIRLSAADKLAVRQKRAQGRLDEELDLLTARQANWAAAERMAEKHGHKPAYWYKQIIHERHAQLQAKKISPWNVFVKQELTKLNDGTSFFFW